MEKTMRLAVCDRPGHIKIKIVPIPRVDGDMILVKVSICGICNSDIVAWRNKGYKTYPYSPGHEFCGVIQELGPETRGLRLGQRVVVNPNFGCGECRYCKVGKPNLCDSLKTRRTKSNGGFSEYVALDYRMAYPLPELFPDEFAPFIEPLSCAVHAARRINAMPDELIGVFGAGIMGLLTGLVLKSSEYETIFIEPSDIRRQKLVELLNATCLTPSELEDSEFFGKMDAAVDCSGAAIAVSQAVRTLRKAGRLVLAGLVTSTKGVDISLMDVTMKELDIRGAWLNPNSFDEAINLAVKYENILRQLKTRTLVIDDIAVAFEQAARQEFDKIFIKIKNG